MVRHSIIPAVHLFLIKDNTILLSRRFQTGFEDGKYSVPAGHVEAGETATQAVLREAAEEVGITCLLSYTQFVHVMHRKRQGEEQERVDFFFVCTKWRGRVRNCEPEKCDDLSWFALNKLPSNTVPYVRFAIRQYRKAISFSEYGWQGEP